MVLIYIGIMTNDVVNLFFGEVSIQIFCPFLSGWLHSHYSVATIFLYFQYKFFRINMFAKYFLPFYNLPFQGMSSIIYFIMARLEIYYPSKSQFSCL